MKGKDDHKFHENNELATLMIPKIGQLIDILSVPAHDSGCLHTIQHLPEIQLTYQYDNSTITKIMKKWFTGKFLGYKAVNVLSSFITFEEKLS